MRGKLRNATWPKASTTSFNEARALCAGSYAFADALKQADFLQ